MGSSVEEAQQTLERVNGFGGKFIISANYDVNDLGLTCALYRLE